MGMFSRMSDIVQANINAMLDKAENPEKVIRLIIQEMEETLVEIRSVAAKNLAEQKQLDRQIDSLQKQSDGWDEKAFLAVNKNRDDLAKAALSEKHTVVAKIEQLHSSKQQLDEVITNIQQDTARLQAKLSEARAKQKSLASRQQTSVARLHAKQSLHSDAITNAVARFEHYEHRVDELEAQVDAYDIVPESAMLQQQFADLEKDESVNAELEALKAKLNKKSKTKAAA